MSAMRYACLLHVRTIHVEILFVCFFLVPLEFRNLNSLCGNTVSSDNPVRGHFQTTFADLNVTMTLGGGGGGSGALTLLLTTRVDMLQHAHGYGFVYTHVGLV